MVLFSFKLAEPLSKGLDWLSLRLARAASGGLLLAAEHFQTNVFWTFGAGPNLRENENLIAVACLRWAPAGKNQHMQDRTKTKSIDVRTVYERLVKADYGEVIPYDDLSRLIGKDVRTVARNVLRSARERAERENCIVFGAVPNAGIRRLTENEVVDEGAVVNKKIDQAAERMLHRLGTVDLIWLKSQDHDFQKHYREQVAYWLLCRILMNPAVENCIALRHDRPMPPDQVIAEIRQLLSLAEKDNHGFSWFRDSNISPVQ